MSSKSSYTPEQQRAYQEHWLSQHPDYWRKNWAARKDRVNAERRRKSLMDAFQRPEVRLHRCICKTCGMRMYAPGNAVAVPVSEWLGHRLVVVDAL